MAGNLEMNGWEGNGHVEVGGEARDEKSGPQPEHSLQEIAEGGSVVVDSASSSTDIAIPEKHGKRRHHQTRHKKTAVQDGVDTEKNIIEPSDKGVPGASEKKITGAHNKKITGASWKYGEGTKPRTTDKPEHVLNANAAPWTPEGLEQSRASLSQSWKRSLLPSTKKLLVLDVNGLLVARYKKIDMNIIPHGTVHGVVAKSVMFKRPFCESFLDFCFENFHVGVWSSMMEANVRKSLDFICQGMQQKLMFVMHQGDCTDTGLRNPDKKKSPLFLKELAKVWAKFPPGQFNESNTLLIDDTPYKALRNPPHTAIFPEPYSYNAGDSFLKKTLTEYLKQLRDAADVREFVRTHPIGGPAIAPGCLHWTVYETLFKTKLRDDSHSHSHSPLHTTPPVTSLPQLQIPSPEVRALHLEPKRLENLSLT